MIRAGTDSRSEPLALPTITIFDLEYTAWECSMARHWLVPGEFKEVVQIGAVRLDADTLTVLDELEILVRPPGRGFRVRLWPVCAICGRGTHRRLRP